MSHSTIHSNIWKLSIMRVRQSISIMMPVITLFYQDNGLSLSSIFTLQSVFAIAMFLFEVPTGYFGDRIGTKNSIIVGTVLISLGFLVYAFGHSFLRFAGCEVILACGNAFISGSDSALLYETLKNENQQNQYKKIEGRINFFGEVSGAIGGIIGGILAHYRGLSATMLGEGICVSFSIPFALSLVKTQTHHQSSDTNIWQNIIRIIKYSLHHNKQLKRIIIYTGILSTASLCMVRAMQPYLKLIGLPIARFGIARFILRGTVSLSGLFAQQRDRKLGLRRGLLGLLGLGVAGYLTVGLNPFTQLNLYGGLMIGFFGIFLLHIQRGLQKPITNHAINELADSEIRATVLSVNSMIGRLMYVVLGPIVGWFGDLYDLQTMFIISAAIFGTLGLFSFYHLFRSHNQLYS